MCNHPSSFLHKFFPCCFHFRKYVLTKSHYYHFNSLKIPRQTLNSALFDIFYKCMRGKNLFVARISIHHAVQKLLLHFSHFYSARVFSLCVCTLPPKLNFASALCECVGVNSRIPEATLQPVTHCQGKTAMCGGNLVGIMT